MATIVAGVDVCKAGWFVVLWDTDADTFISHVVPDFSSVLTVADSATVIAIDIPIGLLTHALPGGRVCDVYARKILHPNRMSCVFSPPVRGTLEAATYPEAVTINRNSSHYDCALSKQCFGIIPKIREVDHLMTPKLQEKVREAHPELCFHALNRGATLSQAKRTPEGRAERLKLLVQHGFAPLIAHLFGSRVEGAAPDDVLDACATCWSARRIAEGRADRIPQEPHRDACGLRMEMWC